MSANSSVAELQGVLNEIISTLSAHFISLHTASPGITGANEVVGGSYARQSTTWGSPSSANPSSVTGSQVTINVPASTTITHWGLWTLASGGSYEDGGPLPGSATYTSAGTYLLTPTLTAS